MTRTEELREKIAKQLRQWDIDNWYGCPQKDTDGNPSMQRGWLSQPQHVKDSYLNKANQILKACQKAGLVFVVGGELSPLPPWLSSKPKDCWVDYDYEYMQGWKDAQEAILKAKWKQVEDIDTREPR